MRPRATHPTDFPLPAPASFPVQAENTRAVFNALHPAFCLNIMNMHQFTTSSRQ